MRIIEFIFGAFSGVAGNVIYETLKKHFKVSKLDELIEYKKQNEFDNFKKVIDSAIEFNQQLEEDLQSLTNKNNVVQNNNISNISGNIFYTEKNINVNMYNYKDIKKALTHLPRKVETFVGREDELKYIKDNFKNYNTLILVNGIGGIGKSAIAKEFLNKNSFDCKAWINYKDSLTSSIVKDLNPRFGFTGDEIEVYNKIIYELNNLSGNNLMIIDNFDNSLKEAKTLTKDFLPNFKILITSRSKIDGINTINIEKLNDDEAIRLFEKHCTKAYDKKQLKNLLNHIDNHSLLIELIAQIIQNSYLNSLDLIYEKFKDKNLQEIKTKIDFKDKSDLIIEHIKALFKLDSLTQKQILILKKFAVLPSVEISFDDLIAIFKIDEDSLSEFENELNELVSKGWLNQNNSNYKAHQLIIEFINLEQKPTFEDVKDIVEYFIDKLYLESVENPIDKFKYIIFAKNILETIKEENKEIATLSNNLSLIYKDLGDLSSALEFAKKTNEIFEKVLDKNHHNLASSYNNLSLIYKALGDLKSALEFANKFLEIRKKVLDKNHPDLATSYSNLSMIYQDLGDLKNALEFANKSLEIREKVFDKNHPDLATSYNNLSMIYKDLGDLSSALEFAKKALEISEKVFGENHPSLATSYNNLSMIYLDLEKYQKAKEYSLKSIKILEKIFSNEHPYLNITRNNLTAIEISIKELINGSFIKNVKINNFKLLKNFELELNSNLNILIGQNSSGKTSLLQAIALCCLPKNSERRELKEFEFYITKKFNTSKIQIEFSKGIVQQKDIYLDETSDIDIKEEYLEILVFAYGSNIFTKYEKLSCEKIAEDIKQKQGKKYFVKSLFEDYFDEFYDTLELLEEFERTEQQELKKEFIEIINKFLKGLEFAISEDGKYFISNDNNSVELKLKNLSEGYRNTILLLTDILIRIYSNGEKPAEIRAIVLIDEFDRHLHPTWQSKLVTNLKEAFPNIQFIITTHNPMSILDREPDEIINLETTKDGIKATKKSVGTKTIDVGMVLLKYFKVDSLVGKTMKDKIEKFTRLKIKNELNQNEKNELLELEEFFESSIATNFIYNNAYFEFLKFVKKNKDIDFEKDELNDLSDEELDRLLNQYKESIQ